MKIPTLALLPIGLTLLLPAAEYGPPAELPAFPGAVGFGARATGGRGGAVYHVTNLNDDGPGSFRDAVRQGKRIVVFDVGGSIELKSPLLLASDLTIAGQTAPGEGIVLRNYQVSLLGQKNVIIRYLRFRVGMTKGQEKKYTLNLNETSSVILDHCSVQWGRWDCIGMTKADGVTLQYCIIGEGLDPQRFGCLCQSDNVTFVYNLWVNNQSRSPKAKGTIQYINNVVYNWGVTGYVGGHSAADHPADLIGNYFIKGPSSNDRFAGEFAATDHIYQSGNLADLNRDGVLNGRPVTAADVPAAMLQDHPFFATPAFPPDSAPEAYRKVIAGAGASRQRDAVDRRLIEEVQSLGKRGTITRDLATLGPIPPIHGGTPPTDADKDGMPDDWEKKHGLNPNDPSDANGDFDHTGYTNIEKYLNELAGNS